MLWCWLWSWHWICFEFTGNCCSSIKVYNNIIWKFFFNQIVSIVSWAKVGEAQITRLFRRCLGLIIFKFFSKSNFRWTVFFFKPANVFIVFFINSFINIHVMSFHHHSDQVVRWWEIFRTQKFIQLLVLNRYVSATFFFTILIKFEWLNYLKSTD